MATFLLIIIYIAFISLGLPDAVLGAAWPVMQTTLDAPMEAAGYLFSMVSVGTILSSLFSGRMLNRFGTGRVTMVSVLMTATALLGFHFAPSLSWLFLFTLPLGLGAGAVDAGLNDFISVHYQAHHMNWLHSFWGVGATIGPIVLAQYMANGNSWRDGYFLIAIFQFILSAVLLLTLPIWSKVSRKQKFIVETDHAQPHHPELEKESSLHPFKMKGVNYALFTFLFYSGIEQTVGLWGSTFLVDVKNIEPAQAARWVSFYFLGITIGRFVSGFVSFKLTNRQLIRAGQMIALLGVILLILPLPNVISLMSYITIGFGLAPIFPSMLHETPARFGKKNSQTIMGYQMAVGYTGTTILPPLFGMIASRTTTAFMPVFLISYAVIMIASTERLNRLKPELVPLNKESTSVSR